MAREFFKGIFSLNRNLDLFDGEKIAHFETLVDVLKSLKQNLRIVVYAYEIDSIYLDACALKLPKSLKVRLKSEFGATILSIKYFNVEIKNAKEFYKGLSLGEIAEIENISEQDELKLVHAAIDHRRLATPNQTPAELPATLIGYVKRDLYSALFKPQTKTGYFHYLAESITRETHDVFASCKSGGLCGMDYDLKGMRIKVNSYDFTSFYPWIMATQKFPFHKYQIFYDVPESVLSRAPLWIATLDLEYAHPKSLNWLKLTDTTVTLTSLDFEILKSDYVFKIKSIKCFIPFTHPRQLPKPLISKIKTAFEKKKNAQSTAEKHSSKVFLNSIFGLFCQNRDKYGQQIDCYAAKLRPYVIGIFVAAYGRFYLWHAMRNCAPVYWDTDGFKTFKTVDFKKINRDRGVFSGDMGSLKFEEENADFCAFGNKQYFQNGVLKLSGTDGSLALKYFTEVLKRFPRCGDEIPPEYTSRSYVDFKTGTSFKTKYTIGE